MFTLVVCYLFIAWDHPSHGTIPSLPGAICLCLLGTPNIGGPANFIGTWSPYLTISCIPLGECLSLFAVFVSYTNIGGTANFIVRDLTSPYHVFPMMSVCTCLLFYLTVIKLLSFPCVLILPLPFPFGF